MTPQRTSRTALLLILAALVACSSASTTVAPTRVEQLTFEVTVPPETPAEAGVALVGSHPALGGAGGPGLELRHQGSGRFTASLALLSGEELSYRLVLTRPSAQVELDEEGAVVPPRKLVVRGSRTVSLTVQRWGAEGGVAQPVATFIIQVPEGTPAGAELWLSGNQEALGRWNGAGVRLERTLDGRYATNVALPAGATVEYKVTRGSWATVEKGPGGEEISNRTFQMSPRHKRISYTVERWGDQGRAPPRPPGQLTGSIQYLRNVSSRFLPRSRDIIIWLPPDYESSPLRRYPVLYMHDGQNLMDESTSFAGEWQVDETAQRLVLAGEVEPLIIIGVYNTEDRFAEYTQVRGSGEFERLGGGNADSYGRFLVEELKPLIDRTYRTRPQAQHTGLAGSSLGGLVSMYLGMAHAKTFRRLGVISPSVFWGGRDIVNRVAGLRRKLPLKVWVDIGTEESRGSQETVEDTRMLRDALLAKGWVLDRDLAYLEVQGAAHTESAWAARFGDVLKFLYPARR